MPHPPNTSWLKVRADRTVLRRFRRHCKRLKIDWRAEIALIIGDHEARLFARVDRQRHAELTMIGS